MKSVLVILFTSLFIFVHSHDDATQQCTVTCPARLETDRGPTELPGRRGSKGEVGDRGLKGDKGERGQTDETRDELERFDENMMEIQRNLSKQFEQIKLLVVTSAIASSRRNCDDIPSDGAGDGVYDIFTGSSFTQVYCEFEREGNNWMVFQRRIDGTVDFYLEWDDYVNGFGNKDEEFWLGLQALHEITSSRSYRLRVDLEDWEGNHAYAEYSSFSIGGSRSNYRLSVSGYRGNAGDALSGHNNQPFSTKDRDHDSRSSGNCAVRHHGAWWYRSCHHSNLNGRYLNAGPDSSATGIDWRFWKGRHYSMKRASMKILPN